VVSLAIPLGVSDNEGFVNRAPLLGFVPTILANGRCMRLVLIGPPGSGKGTQAKLLADRLALRYIGTGVILRDAIAHGTPMGKMAEPYLRDGKYVPDRLVNQLIAELFRGYERPAQFVMDGYPRTTAQAIAFNHLLAEEGLPLDGVVRLVIEDDEVVQRLGGRWSCPNPSCGASYHLRNRPPKVAGVCDLCGTRLSQRPDDREETIRRRLEVFHSTTNQLIEHYRELEMLRDVSALDSVETIYDNIVKSIVAKDSSGS